ncbi:MAG: hypothetical protein AB1758_07495 [Candidatus Eremiobacterota bacterium]
MRPVLDPASVVVPQAEAELRYLYEPGLELNYRSSLSVFRSADASPRFTSKSKEEFTTDVRLKVIEQDPSDEGYYVLTYHTPVERQVDGQPAPPGGPRILYTKHTPLGQILEASDPAEASLLLLPEQPVGPGSEWRVTQLQAVQGRIQPIEVVSHYRVVGLDGHRLTIRFDADEVLFRGDSAATEGNVYTVMGKGTFCFDVEAGHLVSLETESTMTSKEEDLLLEVIAMHTMTLQE